MTGLWSHRKLKGISSSCRCGLVWVMFVSDVNLSMMKPTYKLIDTFILSRNATAARFWRLRWCGGVSCDQWQDSCLSVRSSMYKPSSSSFQPLSHTTVFCNRLTATPRNYCWVFLAWRRVRFNQFFRQLEEIRQRTSHTISFISRYRAVL